MTKPNIRTAQGRRWAEVNIMTAKGKRWTELNKCLEPVAALRAELNIKTAQIMP